jgi:hypothetical protein
VNGRTSLFPLAEGSAEDEGQPSKPKLGPAVYSKLKLSNFTGMVSYLVSPDVSGLKTASAIDIYDLNPLSGGAKLKYLTPPSDSSLLVSPQHCYQL